MEYEARAESEPSRGSSIPRAVLELEVEGSEAERGAELDLEPWVESLAQ
jgi:hypothetical protein